MAIIFTKHARDMIRERGLERVSVESAICEPDWIDEGEGGIRYACKRIGQKVLRVVFRHEDKCQIVITAYYDRRLSP